MAALSSALIFTSGSIIGTKPASITCLATSNCWSTTSLMPAGLNARILDRSLVPKMPRSLARANRSSRSGISFINCTPLASSASPLSILRKGTIPLSAKYSAVYLPSTWRSMVFSNKIAARILSLVNAGLVIIRVRISWTFANISSSLL